MNKKELQIKYGGERLWKVVAIIFAIAFIITVGLLDYRSYQMNKKVILDYPEVIYGNLYIGYEDGVRIGYHQDYNETWYRCAKGCVKLEEKGK